LNNNSQTPSTTNALIVLASFTIIIAGMHYASHILIPFMLACFLAIITAPLLRFLLDKKVPAAIAVSIILSLLLSIGLLILVFVGASINEFSREMPFYQEQLKLQLASTLQTLALYGLEFTEKDISDLLNPSIAISMATNALGRLGAILTNSLLISLTIIFILLEASSFKHKIKLAFDNSQSSLEKFESFMHNVNRYLAIKTAISFATGFIIFIGLKIIGVNHPILWGVLAFLLNYIPNIGSIIAAIPAVLVAFIQLGPGAAFATISLFVIVNIMIGNIFEPKIMGKGLGLSTLVVFISLVFWGSIFGPVGMLLSIPLTMIMKIALESNEETRWIGILLGPGGEAKKELDS
jgi:predicted PurR-regulated permease PerM